MYQYRHLVQRQLKVRSVGINLCGEALTRAREASGSVGMEASTALAAEGAFADQRSQASRDRRADRLPDRLRDVEPDEVEQRERTHRVPRAEAHAGVDVGRVHAGLFDQADRAEEVGEEQ